MGFLWGASYVIEKLLSEGFLLAAAAVQESLLDAFLLLVDLTVGNLWPIRVCAAWLESSVQKELHLRENHEGV